MKTNLDKAIFIKPENVVVIIEKDLSKIEHAVLPGPYGQELILDFNEVPIEVFKLDYLKQFAHDLTDEIGMTRGPIHHWGGTEDEGEFPDQPKRDGISICQFLWESSITIHALDELRKVFVNIFSCKPFDSGKAKEFAIKHIQGILAADHDIKRH